MYFHIFAEDPTTLVHHLLCKRFTSWRAVASPWLDWVEMWYLRQQFLLTVYSLGSLSKINAIPGNSPHLDLQCEETQGPELAWGDTGWLQKLKAVQIPFLPSIPDTLLALKASCTINQDYQSIKKLPYQYRSCSNKAIVHVLDCKWVYIDVDSQRFKWILLRAEVLRGIRNTNFPPAEQGRVVTGGTSGFDLAMLKWVFHFKCESFTNTPLLWGKSCGPL